MKKLISILLIVALMFTLTACTSNNNAETDSKAQVSSNVKLDVNCNIYGLNGPTGIGMVELMKKAEEGNGNLNYSVNLVGSNDEIVAKIANGEADIAAVATNLASTLYKKTNGNISVLAINTLGVLTVVTKGEEITDIKSLKGKTIYTTGQGANPEYIISYILEKNGLEVGKDVTLNFVSQPAELVTTVVTNEKAIVIAPQPIATAITVKDTNAKIALDINKEWDKISDTDLVMGCIIARNDFITKNPDAIKIFLNDYKDSISFVNSDIDTAAELCEKYGVITPATVAKKAIPYCNIVFQSGTELKTNLSAYLEFLFSKNPASVGGALPDEKFYYGK